MHFVLGALVGGLLASLFWATATGYIGRPFDGSLASENKKHSPQIYRFLKGDFWILCLIIVPAALQYYVSWSAGLSLNEIGGSFGALNALYTGMAIYGIYVAWRQTQEALVLQRQEMSADDLAAYNQQIEDDLVWIKNAFQLFDRFCRELDPILHKMNLRFIPEDIALKGFEDPGRVDWETAMAFDLAMLSAVEMARDHRVRDCHSKLDDFEAHLETDEGREVFQSLSFVEFFKELSSCIEELSSLPRAVFTIPYSELSFEDYESRTAKRLGLRLKELLQDRPLLSRREALQKEKPQAIQSLFSKKLESF